MEKQEKIAQEIIRLVGGEHNIIQVWHCITRLRFNIENQELIDIDAIKNLSGVLGAQFQSGQFQIIIGSDVTVVYAAIEKILNVNKENHIHTSQITSAIKKKFNPIEQILDTISGIFTPILPAIVGGGLIKGTMALFVVFGWLDGLSSHYQILEIIADAPFHFLPFLIAFSAAKKFQTNESLALALTGILMYPQIITYATSGEVASLQFLFLHIPMYNYASSVVPIILGIWLMSYIDKGINKVIPSSLKMVFSPPLILLITAPLVLTFIAPLGNILGNYLEQFFSFGFEKAGPLAGALMGGLMPLIVITGMHYAFFPGAFVSLNKLGYELMLLPMSLVSNLAQAGATLGSLLTVKDPTVKQIAISSLLPAIFGITEPAIYGVTLKLKYPFYAALIGGSVGGAIFGFFSVKAFAFTLPGILALATYISDDFTKNIGFALLGVILSFSISLLLTLVFMIHQKSTFKK